VADDSSMQIIESEYSLKFRFKIREILNPELRIIFVIVSVY